MNLFNSLKANLVAGAAILLCALAASPVAAQLTGLTGDGWHTWRVAAADTTPEICCYRWNMGQKSSPGCDLDDGHGGFSTDDSNSSVQNELQIYAKLVDGQVTGLRALSPNCPVTSHDAITDLGFVEASASVALIALQMQRSMSADGDIASAGLAALAFHAGREARTALIGQGRNSDDPDLRAQAWFWLAQSGAAESEAEITRAIREDRSSDVRDEGVFALSQLPDQRAVSALVSILEDRRFDMDVREQALFWLAQADSDEAFEYLDAILSDN